MTKEEVEKLSIEKEDIYQSLCLQQKMELAPGVEDFFDYLRINNIPFTIATAADLYNLKFYFKHLNLGKYFDISRIVYSDGTIKSKPNPDVFLKAMDILQILPSETLIFEDSPSGIQAAENSEAQKIIIVQSTDEDYSPWTHQVIGSYAQVDRSIFK